MRPLTRAQREAQTALGNVGARTPRPDRCAADSCREWRGLKWCMDCRRWFCFRHRHMADHACSQAPLGGPRYSG